MRRKLNKDITPLMKIPLYHTHKLVVFPLISALGACLFWKLIACDAYSRLVFSRFFYFRGNLRTVTEKLTRKICFSRKKKRLAPRIYQAKFCLAAFL